MMTSPRNVEAVSGDRRRSEPRRSPRLQRHGGNSARSSTASSTAQEDPFTAQIQSRQYHSPRKQLRHLFTKVTRDDSRYYGRHGQCIEKDGDALEGLMMDSLRPEIHSFLGEDSNWNLEKCVPRLLKFVVNIANSRPKPFEHSKQFGLPWPRDLSSHRQRTSHTLRKVSGRLTGLDPIVLLHWPSIQSIA